MKKNLFSIVIIIPQTKNSLDYDLKSENKVCVWVGGRAEGRGDVAYINTFLSQALRVLSFVERKPQTILFP